MKKSFADWSVIIVDLDQHFLIADFLVTCICNEFHNLDQEVMVFSM